jgi:hypothetical protein
MRVRSIGVCCAIIVLFGSSGCHTATTSPGSLTPIPLQGVAFAPATSTHIHFATPATPRTVLKGRHYDSDEDGDVDASDVDTSHQTREFTYSQVTVNGVPAVNVNVLETDNGAVVSAWSFALARATNGAVYVVRYQSGGPFDFIAGSANAEPVLFLPYDSAGVLVPGTAYPGGFNHQFEPLRTWQIEAVDVTTPFGLTGTTDLHVDVGELSDRHLWFSDSNGIVETDGGFSLAVAPLGG